MCSPHALYVALDGNDVERQSCYRQWIGESIATEVIGKIRHCPNTGLVLGSEAFREDVNGLTQ
jgi:hypothetical protein